MSVFRRAITAPTLALILAAGLGAAPAAAGDEPVTIPQALSSADRISYTTAFDALRRGELEEARRLARQAQDRVLLGQVEFERLFHPEHAATYEELKAWLDDYADLPCAPRVYALALRRRPDGAEEPRNPSVLARTWGAVAATVAGAMDDPAKAARVAYNNDDLAGAFAVGQEIGDWWTVGLAAWRLNRFHEAFNAFERVANDPTEDAWVRAGAGVWAARAAGQSGRQDRIQPLLRLAAQYPATFYGQIALRQLGEEPVIENQGPRPYNAVPVLTPVSYSPSGVDERELEAFVRSDARARRTLAFHEVGRRSDAEEELRTGLRTAAGDAARRMWTALASVLNPRTPGAAEAMHVDAQNYPVPELQPDGGFTVERALVYALVRKETNFDPDARSGAGAYGMMQVMPSTAAELSGDNSFVSEPERLLIPATNLRLGQAYINRMLAREAFNGDLLRAVASYNAGPGPMLAALRKLGPDPDPLLLIETIDVPQARDYVEKVVAAYWVYQRMFGGPLNTLDAVASGARTVPLSLDRTGPQPAQAAWLSLGAAP